MPVISRTIFKDHGYWPDPHKPCQVTFPPSFPSLPIYSLPLQCPVPSSKDKRLLLVIACGLRLSTIPLLPPLYEHQGLILASAMDKLLLAALSLRLSIIPFLQPLHENRHLIPASKDKSLVIHRLLPSIISFPMSLHKHQSGAGPPELQYMCGMSSISQAYIQ
jgi:hypothetical protein